MGDTLDLTCHACGHTGFSDGSDGFFYCRRCGSQAEDIIDIAVNDEDNPGGTYSAIHGRKRRATVVKVELPSQSQPHSQFWESLKTLDEDASDRVKKEDGLDGVGPTGPSDFGSGLGPVNYDDYYSELRVRYVMGLQIMIQLQCKALVEEFKVSPLICGLAGTIWLRYVASSKVFDDDWADEVIHESESQKEGFQDDFRPSAKYHAEPHNIHGQRAVMVWYRALKQTIPLSHTLVISYLVCHLAREAVLPTDILKWSLEGKLPYFAAFLDIEKQIGPPSVSCTVSSSLMFRPSEPVSLFKLESRASSIAKEIGLELPPVNFYSIASRYLRKLSLPVGKILPSVCQIYEWSLPPELWLSANEFRLPTRVCVLSMVIVAIRILYNIHGLGYWERSLSSSILTSGDSHEEPTPSSADARNEASGLPSRGLDGSSTNSAKNLGHIEKPELETMELLRDLEARYDELEETYEYSKDLSTYLQYCKDVVFAGLEPSFEDLEEERVIEELWNYYQDKKDSGPSNDQDCDGVSRPKRSRDDAMISAKESKKLRDDGSPCNRSSYPNDSSQQGMSFDDCPPSGTDSEKDRGIRQLKLNMEDNRFCYIPPRVNVKRRDYLQYVRKKDKGAYTYAAHADYYILLRSCARIAQVDIRVMHIGVLSFERRLGWLEKRIDNCLAQLGSGKDYCEHCREEINQEGRDDSVDVSKLNL